jgi:hypothetical protein
VLARHKHTVWPPGLLGGGDRLHAALLHWPQRHPAGVRADGGYSHYGSLFDTADDAIFDYVILGQLRNASRRVIAKAMGRPG